MAESERETKQSMDVVEEEQAVEKESKATTEPVVTPATEPAEPTPDGVTEDKPEAVPEVQEEKESDEIKKEDGDSRETVEAQKDGEGMKEEGAGSLEVDRPGSKLSRIEEEPETETTTV